MQCEHVINQVDEFLDDALPQTARLAFEGHVAACDACAGVLEQHRSIMQRLADLPVDAPDPEFFANVLDKAAEAAPRPRSIVYRWRHGLVAAAAVLLVAGLSMQAGVFSSARDVPEVTIALHEVTPVALRFSSAVELENARLSLQLPEGVALAGYTGRKSLSWRTDLKAGDNVLELPLVGYVAATDRLTAEVEHPDGSKSFALQITVN